MLLCIVDTRMRRNMFVLPLFLYPITMCKCNYSSFLTIDPPPPNHLFFIFQAIFSLCSSCWIHQPTTSSPCYLWHCCMSSVYPSVLHGWLLHVLFCTILLLVVLSTLCDELNIISYICMILPQDIYVSLHVTISANWCNVACWVDLAVSANPSLLCVHMYPLIKDHGLFHHIYNRSFDPVFLCPLIQSIKVHKIIYDYSRW